MSACTEYDLIMMGINSTASSENGRCMYIRGRYLPFKIIEADALAIKGHDDLSVIMGCEPCSHAVETS